MFKHSALLIGLVAGLTLGGCTLVPGAVGSPPAVVSSTLDEKALLTAETGFRITLIAVNGALDANRIPPNDAPKIKAALVRAKQALDTARAAYAVGNAVQMKASIADANILVGVVGALIGKI